MKKLSYKAVKPYLKEAVRQGNNLHCIFEIEEEQFESEVAIQKVNPQEKFGKIVQTPTIMRSILLRMLKKQATSKTATEEPLEDFSAKDIQAATVHAFEQITNEIVYLETTDKWHLATQFSAFEVYIRQNPLTAIYDKKIMSRMLVEMARADGQIAEKERLFFEHFLNEETGQLRDLIGAPFLSLKDCKQVSAKGRATIFLIVAAVALTDNSFDDRESEKLQHFAQLFELSKEQQTELFQIAQEYTMEMTIKINQGDMKEEELYSFADQIGMDRALAEQVKIRVQ